MIWARMLAYVTGTVDQELLLRNEYYETENEAFSMRLRFLTIRDHRGLCR
jgi:hypothetical protein